MKKYNLAILGATGAVGREMLKVLAERDFPVGELKLLASARSVGKEIEFKGNIYKVEEASKDSFAGVDIVLGAASNALAKELAPQFILDFMQSGYFIYCGDDCWDLKDRQPTSILDKDGHDYEKALETDEVIENENWNYVASNDSEESEESDEDNDEKQEEDEFDLTREFELRAEEELDNLFADQQEEE